MLLPLIFQWICDFYWTVDDGCTVSKVRNLSLTNFEQKYRESKYFTKNRSVKLISRNIFQVIVFFSHGLVVFITWMKYFAQKLAVSIVKFHRMSDNSRSWLYLGHFTMILCKDDNSSQRYREFKRWMLNFSSLES